LTSQAPPSRSQKKKSQKEAELPGAIATTVMSLCPRTAGTLAPPNARKISRKSDLLQSRALKGSATNATTTRAAVASATAAAEARRRLTTGAAGTAVGTIAERKGMRTSGESVGVGVVIATHHRNRMGERTEDGIGMVATIMAPVMGRVERSIETRLVKKREEIMLRDGIKEAANTTRSTDPLLYIFIYSLY
jgi:hypothetical protein